MAERGRVLQQQREVARAALDRADQLRQAAQGDQGLPGPPRFDHHRGDQPVEALATDQAQLAGLRVAAQLVEQAQGLGGRVEAAPGQDLRRLAGVQALLPDRASVGFQAAVGLVAAGGLEEHPEVAVHHRRGAGRARP